MKSLKDLTKTAVHKISILYVHDQSIETTEKWTAHLGAKLPSIILRDLYKDSRILLCQEIDGGGGRTSVCKKIRSDKLSELYLKTLKKFCDMLSERNFRDFQ